MKRFIFACTVVCHVWLGIAPVRADSFSALGFNGRQDVGVWADGMEALGAQKGAVVRDDAPSLAALKSLFGRSDEWLYLAGHFSGARLYNEVDSVSVQFFEDKVVLVNGGETVELKRGSGFKQHEKLKVLFWGGCATHAHDATVQMLRKLFGIAVVQVGWIGETGWEMPLLCMGGKLGNQQYSKNFFSQMAGGLNPGQVRDAWLRSADAIYWGNDKYGVPFRPRFSVIDSAGQQYLLKGKVEVNQGQIKGKSY